MRSELLEKFKNEIKQINPKIRKELFNLIGVLLLAGSMVFSIVWCTKGFKIAILGLWDLIAWLVPVCGIFFLTGLGFLLLWAFIGTLLGIDDT